jgi:pimeloyl-ACP methyl ester carboxylesterase
MSKVSYKDGLVTVGGYKMHYLEWGKSGDQIVLLHSMGMDAHGFDAFSESLSKDYHILAIDLLGHGYSNSPKEPVGVEEHTEVIRGVALDRGFKKNILIGHSIGGMISMIYAAKYPKEVEKVVLVDIAPRDVSAAPVRPTAPPVQPPDFFANEEEALKYLRQRYSRFDEAALQNRLKYAFRRDVDGRLRLKASPVASATLRGSLSVDLWPFVSKIAAPMLLLIGSESQTVSKATVEKMRGMLKDIKVLTIDGATHMVPQDRPKEFEKAVKEFLQQKGK